MSLVWTHESANVIFSTFLFILRLFPSTISSNLHLYKKINQHLYTNKISNHSNAYKYSKNCIQKNPIKPYKNRPFLFNFLHAESQLKSSQFANIKRVLFLRKGAFYNRRKRQTSSVHRKRINARIYGGRMRESRFFSHPGFPGRFFWNFFSDEIWYLEFSRMSCLECGEECRMSSRISRQRSLYQPQSDRYYYASRFRKAGSVFRIGAELFFLEEVMNRFMKIIYGVFGVFFLVYA